MNDAHLRLPRFNSARLAAGSMRALLVAMAAGVCAVAHAEYRCTSPHAPADRHACQLAAQNNADGLRHYVQRTASIYGLYFYDYVKPADFNRWHAARRDTKGPSLGSGRATLEIAPRLGRRQPDKSAPC